MPNEQVVQLADALASLPEAQREALTLHHLQEWTLDQVAEHLDAARPQWPDRSMAGCNACDSTSMQRDEPCRPPRASDSARDERVNQIIAAYLKSIEEGTRPIAKSCWRSTRTWPPSWPAFFADQDRFQQAAAPLRAPRRALRAATRRPMDFAASPSPGPGARIRYFGDYELLEEIARGGMGVVYKARQVSLKRVVAEDDPGRPIGRPRTVQRFHTEAEAAAKLDHPGIVPIFEVGQHEGQHYFSMALRRGREPGRTAWPGPLIEPREAAALIAGGGRSGPLRPRSKA